MLAAVMSFLLLCNRLNISGLPPPCRVGNGLATNLLHQHPTAPRTERGEGDEEQETPVPPAVEDIAGHDHESVLQTQLPLRLAEEPVKDVPIEQENYRQENSKLDRIE